MDKNKPRLPLVALRAFEAAARHQSITRAAEELFITSGAVSQQVKLLEESVGVPLLRRRGRGVELTDAGQVLRPVLTQAFQSIELSLDAIGRRHKQRITLRLCLLPTLAEKWLMPRIGWFHANHPDTDIQILTSFRKIRFEEEDVDMASFVGAKLPAGHDGVRLFADEFLPVCSPALLKVKRAMRIPSDLAEATLLHSVRRMDDWERWLEVAGASGLRAKRALSFENSSLAIQAALDGVGVAVVQRAYVLEHLKTGALVAPFEIVGRSNSCYYLVWPTDAPRNEAFTAFREWVVDEARRARSVARQRTP